jgi:hypothetical protein
MHVKPGDRVRVHRTDYCQTDLLGTVIATNRFVRVRFDYDRVKTVALKPSYYLQWVIVGGGSETFCEPEDVERLPL